MRKLTILLALIAIGTTAFVGSITEESVSEASKPPYAMTQQSRTVIDGKLTPDKIPNHEAYIILFRLVANRETEEEKNRIRAYLRQAFACDDCKKDGQSPTPEEIMEADIDAVIHASEEFNQRVSVFDHEATEVYERHHPTHPPLNWSDKERMRQLQRQKETTADEVAASLDRRLSRDGRKSLRRYVKEHMKSKMKMSVTQEQS